MKKAKKTTKAKPVADTGVMTGDELRSNIEKLYGNAQSQSAFARLIGVGNRTVRSWIADVFPVPKPVGYLVALMIRTKTKPDELKV